MTEFLSNDAGEVRIGLAKHFKPKPNYAELPIQWAFSRTEALIPLLDANDVGQIDGTAFYSWRDDVPMDVRLELFRRDKRAREKAVEIGGLIAYFGGAVIENGNKGRGPYDIPFTPNCMSTCWWVSEDAARAGSSTPEHLDAIAYARHVFGENMAIVKYKLAVKELDWRRPPIVNEQAWRQLEDQAQAGRRLVFECVEQPQVPEKQFYYPKSLAA